MTIRILAAALVCVGAVFGQENAATAAGKPTEHVIGTLTAVDTAAQTITVKEDGTGAARVVQVGGAKTLLKVPPGAKDLKSATRITAADLATGDRVDVRGFKVESDPTGIAARSIILMSGAEVQQVHQKEAAEWQHASTGTVVSLDATTQKLNVNLRTPQGPKPLTLDASGAQFMRYSPEKPQTPVPSQLSEIQPGDQVRFLSDDSSTAEAGGTVHAQKIYSGTFKSAVGTVVSVAPDGKSLVIKDLQTKQPLTVALGEESAVRKLPQMMAYMLARRFNPDFKGAPQATGTPAAAPGENGGPPPGRPAGTEGARQGGMSPGGGMMRGGGSGDLSQMLERVPKIPVTDLKPGDAVVVSGSPATGVKGTLLAQTVVAGVEPIFQSASPRQAQSLSDWSNSLGGGMPGEAGGGGQAGGPPQ